MSTPFYDAIVVGARCAGASTAMLLARKGLKVLLVDRASFPSDAISTHTLQLHGLAILEHWGLLRQVQASGCPPIQRISLDFGSFALVGTPPPAGNVTDTLCCRRIVLDQILLEQAIAAGAVWHDGISITGLLYEQDRVMGVRGQSLKGENFSAYATVVIGADGINSSIARFVGATTYYAVPSLTFSYYSYWEGIALDHSELFVREGCALALVPTNRQLTIVVVQKRISEFSAFRKNIEQHFILTLNQMEKIRDLLAQGRRVERFRGTAHQPHFFRTSYGNGWALVGDAACHKDSVTAQGISDAFQDAESLAQAVSEGLTGTKLLRTALQEHHRHREKRLLPVYRRTLQLARLEAPSGPAEQFLRSLRENQTEVDRFFGLDAGTVHVDEFYPSRL